MDPAIYELGVPILGICYGAQLKSAITPTQCARPVRPFAIGGGSSLVGEDRVLGSPALVGRREDLP